MRDCNQKKYSLPLIVACCGIMLFAFSCKSSKEAAKVTLEEKSKNERIELVNTNSLQYRTFSGSLKFSIKPGQKKSNTTAPAQLRIIKDEALQLSVRMPILGNELFRLMISPDSLIIIDRTNKQYFAESMGIIKMIAPVDFDYYNLQAMFTNHLFIAGKQTISSDDYAGLSFEQTDFLAYIRNRDRQKIEYTFTSDYTNRIQSTEMKLADKQADLLWKYGEFGATVDRQVFPMKMDMSLTLPKDVFTMGFAFNKVEVNTDISIDFSIPKGYQTITLAQLLNLIEKL